MPQRYTPPPFAHAVPWECFSIYLTLQLRHQVSGHTCSIDYSLIASDASNRADCADPGGAVPSAPSAAGPVVALAPTPIVPVGPPAIIILASPEISSPASQTVPPGASDVETFQVTNRSSVPRTFVFDVRSEHPATVADPPNPDPVTIGAGQTVPVSVSYAVSPSAAAGATARVVLRATDSRDGTPSGEGGFGAVAAEVLVAPTVAGPADHEAEPGELFGDTWTVRNESNVARTLRITPRVVAGDPAQLTGSSGTGDVVLGPGQSQVVRGVFRLDAGLAAGTTARIVLRAEDVAAPAYAREVQHRVGAESVPATPNVTAPADRGARAGSSFSASWSITNTSNGTRTFTLTHASSVPGSVGADPGAASTVSIGPGATYALAVSYTVAAGAPVGSQPTLSLAVADAAAPEYNRSASFVVTVEAANQAPTVSLTASPVSVKLGDPVSFVATGSDPDGDPLTFEIRTGDGAVIAGASGAHAYLDPNTYYATAVVSDGQGGNATSDPVRIDVLVTKLGCMDPAASNYDPEATEPTTCEYTLRVTVNDVTPGLILHGDYGKIVEGGNGFGSGQWPDPAEYSITATGGAGDAITLTIGGRVCGSGVGSVTCTGIMPNSDAGDLGRWLISYAATRNTDRIQGEHEYFTCLVLWDDPDTGNQETGVREMPPLTQPYLAGQNSNGSCDRI